MNLFETAAYAAEAGAAPGPGYMDTVCFWSASSASSTSFCGGRRASVAKNTQALMSGLAKGDEVVTAGGIVGRISKVEDDFVKLQVSNNVELRIQKSAVGATLPKGTLKSLDEK